MSQYLPGNTCSINTVKALSLLGLLLQLISHCIITSCISLVQVKCLSIYMYVNNATHI